MSDFSFNADNEEVEEDEFTAMPDHNGKFIITKSEWKKTKDKEGTYLELTIKELEGKYKNRMVWNRLNLVNKNPKTVNISKRELLAILWAVNEVEINKENTSLLHNKPFLGKCVFVEGSKGYQDSNTIRNITNMDGETRPKDGKKNKNTKPVEKETAAAKESVEAASSDDNWFDT